MLIDWFTVIAQAVNFLILVWLLKRFLYKPMLDAIDAREQRIAAQLKDAAAKEAEATQEKEDYQHRNEELARQGDGLLDEARGEARSERRKLMEEARQEAGALRGRLEKAVESERAVLSRDLTSRAQKEVLAIARKTLADLAGVSLEERMTEVFIRRLSDLGADGTAEIAASLKASNRPARVRTVFEPSPEQRAAIESAIRERLHAVREVLFETSSALISGIELTVNGHKIAWSIADYLSSLEKSVGEILEAGHGNDQ